MFSFQNPWNDQQQMTTSFPGSLFFPPKEIPPFGDAFGGKKRDPGNEIATDDSVNILFLLTISIHRQADR